MGKNGHNGNNGHNGKNGKNGHNGMNGHGHIKLGLNESFKPSERQQQFREIASVEVEAGRTFRSEWFRASRTQMDKPVRKADWDRWGLHPGFMGWFETALDDIFELGHLEQRLMDAEFWNSIRRGLRDGDARSMQLYADIRFKRDSNPLDTAREFDEFLSGAGAERWRIPAEA